MLTCPAPAEHPVRKTIVSQGVCAVEISVCAYKGAHREQTFFIKVAADFQLK